MSHKAPQLVIELDSSLLVSLIDRFGVRVWNRFVGEMLNQGIAKLGWQEGEYLPAAILFSFHDADLSRRDLRTLDLSACDMSGSRFDGSALSSARMGWVEGCSFREADLSDVDFSFCSLSGADFTGATMEGVMLDGATYDEKPRGLPDGLLLLCQHDPSVERAAVCVQETPLSATVTLAAIPSDAEA